MAKHRGTQGAQTQHKQAIKGVEHAGGHRMYTVLVHTLYMGPFINEGAAITWLEQVVDHLFNVGLDGEAELIADDYKITAGVTVESYGLTQALKAVRVLTAIPRLRPRSEPHS